MKKYLAGGSSTDKCYEVAYIRSSDNESNTNYTKVIASDIVEAAEILISVEGIKVKDIEYILLVRSEKIIG